jgi:ankyrin repeat protein
VNAADPRRRQTALMWAAAEGHTEVVTALIEIGADVKAVSRNGFTPLLFATTKNDVASINALLAAGADPNYTLPSGGKPLIVAMAYRHTNAALALLDGGADINTRDRAGNAPLHVAAQVGDVEIVKKLLAKGADPNVRTPKSIAPAVGRGGGGGFRGGPSGEQTSLMMAARGDHEELMRLLVAAGADPSLKAQDGANLLMAAAGGARLKTLTYAYELDPNVDVVTTPVQNTIMHLAVAQNGRTQPEVVEVMQFLADRGAKLDEMNAANRTPIATADGLPVDMAVDLLTKLITERGEKPKIPSRR